MKSVRIDLNSTIECTRKLTLERRVQPFFGVVGIELIQASKSSLSFKMIDLNDDYVAKSFSNDDCYEPVMIREWLNCVEESKGSILDIGASTGLYSLLAAAMRRGQRIHAFEPYSRAFARLVNNKEINNFPKIEIHPVAIGSEAGYAEFLIKNFEGPITTSGKIAVLDSGVKMLVRLQTLTNELRTDEPISLIKIDVEGYELIVLKNIKTIINRWKPIVFFEALTQSSLKDLADFFIEQQYEVYCLRDDCSLIEPLPKKIEMLSSRNFVARHC